MNIRIHQKMMNMILLMMQRQNLMTNIRKRRQTTIPTLPIAYSYCGEIHCECVFSEDSINTEEYDEFYRDINLDKAVEEAVEDINEYIKETYNKSSMSEQKKEEI